MAVLYKITHVTKFVYGEPAPVCHNELCLTPRETPLQRCPENRILIVPEPAAIGERFDYYGNRIKHFSVHESHRMLTVTALSRVEMLADAPSTPLPAAVAPPSPPWNTIRDQLPLGRQPEELMAYQFAFASPRIVLSRDLADYARPSFPNDRPIIEAVVDLMQRIHAQFHYDAKATTVTTPVAEVLRGRRGVCQDFAHLQIGCLRSLGLAARYVSGYLRTIPPSGKQRLVGADASHAWLSVFCGPLGWIDFDPTNAMLPATDHITLAWGRDYADVCPIRGVFIGGGSHHMTVSVDVEPVPA